MFLEPSDESRQTETHYLFPDVDLDHGKLSYTVVIDEVIGNYESQKTQNSSSKNPKSRSHSLFPAPNEAETSHGAAKTQGRQEFSVWRIISSVFRRLLPSLRPAEKRTLF